MYQSSKTIMMVHSASLFPVPYRLTSAEHVGQIGNLSSASVMYVAMRASREEM